MHARSAGLVLALLAAAAANAAAAERVGVLAVAPPPGPGPELVEVTADLRQRVAELDAGVLEGRALRERMVGPAEGASLAELERAIDGARAAYVSGDHGEAIRTLRAVVADLEKLPEGEEAFRRWTGAMLRLARYELNLGSEEAARSAIEQVVRAAPDLELDRAEHPARLAAEVERARAALAAGPRGRVRITASTQGARVFVNGRDVGAAPVTLTLPHGRCRIAGSSGALHVGPLALEIGEDEQEVLLDFAAVEALRPFGGPGLALAEADRARRLVVAGAHLGLDRLLAVSFADEAGARHVVGSLYDVRRGMLLREGRVRLAGGSVPVRGSSSLAEFLITGRVTTALVEIGAAPAAVSLRVVPPPAAPGALVPTSPAAPPPARGRTLGWASAGAAAAASGLGIFGLYELRASGDSYDQARGMVGYWGPPLSDAEIAEYNAHVTDGDAARRRATISFAAAGVSAAACGILGYVSYRRTGELGPFRF
jgi:hypothetical protein